MSTQAAGFRFQRSVLALMIAAGGGSAVPALAQDGRASALEEVVVTAQRREESLQDTPISITAFTPDRIADLGIHNVTDIGEFAPNISIAKQPGSNVSLAIYIRGVGSAESSVVNDPKVGVYVDGVYVSKAVGGVFDVVDLERVEVLRGPQGTLFGRNTTGGAVNITTKKPTGEFGLKANGTLGNYDTQRYGLRMDLPEYYNVAANLSVNHFQTDGWADNRYDGAGISSLQSDIEDTVASEDNWAYRLALRWTPLDSVTVDYAFDRTDNEGVPSPFQLTGVRTELFNGFTRRPFPFATLGGSLYQQMAAQVGDPDDRKKNLTLDNSTLEWTDIDGHTVNAAWEVNDALTLKYIFGYRYTDNGNTGSDTDGGTYYARDLFYGVLQGNNGEILSPGFSGVTSKNHVDAKTHELQFIGNLFDERLFYTGGLYYFDETTQQDNPQTFSLPIALVAPRSPALPPLYQALGFGCAPPAPAGLLCGSQRLPFPASDPGIPGFVDFRYGQESESWAAYAQFTYEVTESFDFTAGIRYTEDDKDAWLENDNIDTDPVAPGTQTARLQADDQWDNISYVVSGNYSITDDVSVYLKYSTGYNAGGFSARATTVSGFEAPYDEEEVEVWELGLKSEWLDNRVRLNAAVFTNDYTDMQIAQFEAGAGGASSRQVNAGAATYEGFELEFVVVPVEGLTLDANYGYLDTEFDEYMQLNPATNRLENISDIAVATYAPENTWNAGAQYDFAPFSFGALSARLDVTYRDSLVFHPFLNDLTAADDYTLVNGRISLNDIDLGSCCGKGAMRVSLWGKNLADEEYRNFGIDFDSIGFAGNRFGWPRTYGLDVEYAL
ncbi:MAG TPA: TonB-dependent receptor [Pseudomonadales bacterium]|nr:TonB-dependent receptor [Pseudomonadales bacterium]